MKNQEIDQRKMQNKYQSHEAREKDVRRMYARKQRRRKKMKGMIIEGALFCLCLMLVFGFFILKPEMGKPSLLSKKAGTTGTEMIETESSQSEETESDFGKAAPGDRIDANTLVQLIAQAKTIQTDSASQEDAALLKQAIEEAEKAVNSEIDEKNWKK